MADHNGNASGFVVEIVTNIFKNLGHSVHVEIYPWARALSMINSGQSDRIFTIFRTSEREKFLDFSNESIVNQKIYFYGRKSDKFAFNGDFSSLHKVRIGVLHNVSYGPEFDNARSKLLIDEANSMESNIKKLIAGRIDLFPSNAYSASYFINAPGNKDFADKIVQLPVPLSAVPSFLGFAKPKRLTELRDRFDEEVVKFFASDKYSELLIKYNVGDQYLRSSRKKENISH
ncbi:transporter substrate-binding domain-containing protein [Undibacterium jejuense]|uniref:Transporter substrate-binding domain-containing protein n=2 Tax=Undibacterium jejuense TaxID=1344949 RepID=A0A923KMM4_9BURK|nr:transporter substrate-binding domain-containing protein [Undibacterium jejuense]